MMEKLIALLHDESGLTAVEYAVCGGLIAAALVAIFGLLGTTVTAIITAIEAALATSPAL